MAILSTPIRGPTRVFGVSSVGESDTFSIGLLGVHESGGCFGLDGVDLDFGSWGTIESATSGCSMLKFGRSAVLRKLG